MATKIILQLKIFLTQTLLYGASVSIQLHGCGFLVASAIHKPPHSMNLFLSFFFFFCCRTELSTAVLQWKEWNSMLSPSTLFLLKRFWMPHFHPCGRIKFLANYEKKSYVRGFLLPSQIGFNFLLARIGVPKEGTPYYVWTEYRIGGIVFILGVLSTQDSIWKDKQFSMCLGKDGIATWGKSSSTSDGCQDELEISGSHTMTVSTVHRRWSYLGLLPAGV